MHDASTGTQTLDERTTGSRLRWAGAALLPAEARETLMGPGAPFEIVVENVLGVPTEVFARRPPNLPSVLGAAARDHADRVYLSFPNRELTYAEVYDEVRRMATLLDQHHGVRKGDRVAIIAANTLSYALAFWATLELGAVVAGLNGWWAAPEIEYGIELTEPVVLLGDAPRLARLEALHNPLDIPVRDLDDLMGELRSTRPDPPTVEIAEDDPALILFTSGTTGRPKGATLSHRCYLHFPQVSLLGAAIGIAQAGVEPPTEQSASIATGPFFHISGSLGLLSAPRSGGKCVFPAPGRWNETTHFELTERHRISSWSVVPTQLWRIVRHPDLRSFDLSSLRTIGCGGAPFAPELLRETAEKLPGVTLSQGYGMSESTGMGVLTSGPAFVADPTSVGTPPATSEVEVRDVDGRRAPDGEVGEICLRHASVFVGYWANPDATAASLDAERWYRSGDYGRIVDGRLYLESRIRDMIIRGGENVYPVEIENRLVEHPGIAEAAVIGVDHDTLGQEVLAVVVTSADAKLSAAEVRDWVAGALARFKVPSFVAFATELPQTETGKVQKHLLESQLKGGLIRLAD